MAQGGLLSNRGGPARARRASMGRGRIIVAVDFGILLSSALFDTTRCDSVSDHPLTLSMLAVGTTFSSVAYAHTAEVGELFAWTLSRFS
jgi:hypothetical protein